jgi:EAL and modified HD-GYP domain-containing signal transduction protein
MLEMAILGQVALGYSAFIDVKRDVSATRLTVFPIKPDSVLDVSEILAAIKEVWPPEAGLVLLNVASESLLRDLLLSQPSRNVMLEIPAFAACDPENFAALSALHSNANVLMLKGYPLSPLPPELLRCFKYLISDFSEDQRLLEPGSQQAALRALQRVNEGVRSVADMELSFSRGALAVIGWPIDERVTTETASRARAGAQTDLQVVLELIGLVDRQESIDKIEQTLKRDPTLGFKLMKYINSSAFGLKVEIASFRQAIMMLGYQLI